MINENTDITVYPDWVEFRNDCTAGTQVVRVYVRLGLPQILASVEWVFDGQRRREPMSLALDEIVEFCKAACECTGRSADVFAELHQHLISKPCGQLFGDQS